MSDVQGPSRSALNLPKVKYFDGKLNRSQVDLMRFVEKQNRERVNKLHRIRRNNLITAWSIGALVAGIYAYSMFSVKQEKFLDDFEEPKKISHN